MAAKKPATFPATLKLGGDITYSGRTLDLAPDGSELVYGDASSLFRLPRGEKALRKMDTDRYLEGGVALGGGEVVVALSGLGDDPPRLDLFDAARRIATFAVPEEGNPLGLAASRESESLVAWGLTSDRPTLWWWRLGAPAAAPVALPLAAVPFAAAFVGGTLFLSASDKLYAATVKGITHLDGADVSALSGARSGSRLLARSGKSFVVLGTDGGVIRALPPVLKHARLTADGRRVVGYGDAFDVRTPVEARDLYPEWERTNFLAQFDATTGERLGWGKIADSVDAIALADDELVVTKSVKRIAFHPWKVLTG